MKFFQEPLQRQKCSNSAQWEDVPAGGGGATRGPSLALAGRLPSLRLRLGSVDPAWVTAEPVAGFLMAGDVDQLQVVCSEKQAVEVLPGHLPAGPLRNGGLQRGDDSAPLFYYVVQVPRTKEDPALPVTVGVDGVFGCTAVHVKGTLAGEPAFGCAEPAVRLGSSVEVAAVVLLRPELPAHEANNPDVLLLSLRAHRGGRSAHLEDAKGHR